MFTHNLPDERIRDWVGFVWDLDGYPWTESWLETGRDLELYYGNGYWEWHINQVTPYNSRA